MKISLDIERVIVAAAEHGLAVRGGFAVAAGDAAPDVGAAGGQRPAKYLMLFGNVGSSMWAAFRRSAEYGDGRPHSLNRWSDRIGRALAEEFSARALFPFEGPPYRPFLRWAKRAEGLHNSSIGMLIHPVFGLWHAYRFALAFECVPDEPMPVEHAADGGNICRRCDLKPCLRACPVNAFTATGYDVQSCCRYLESHPESKCMTQGCQARVVCPQGAEHRYQPTLAAFHMRAFVASMTRENRLPSDSDEFAALAQRRPPRGKQVG